MAKQNYIFFTFSSLSLLSLCSSRTTTHDVINSPMVFPTNPTTTPPATFPLVTITPTNPAAAVPNTPPVTTIPPPILTPPPVTNPVTQYPPAQPSGTVPVPVPVVAPPVVANSPSSSGQIWCVAKPGASQISLQQALDYACGIVDCSQIQQGGNCYLPNSLQNHASFAFNSYYQKNPSAQSCDFGGAASAVSTNPSTGSCIYQTGSSTSAPAGPTTTTTPTPSTQTVNQPPVTSTPIVPTGGGIIGVGTPPAIFNPANPTSNTLNNPSSGGSAAVYGFDGSPNGNNPTSSDSTHFLSHSSHAIVATLILQAMLFH